MIHPHGVLNIPSIYSRLSTNKMSPRAKGKNEIDGEIDKARILLREGGYFPCVDHGIPPDVPYENFVYFMNELRKLSDYEETRRLIPQSEGMISSISA